MVIAFSLSKDENVPIISHENGPKNNFEESFWVTLQWIRYQNKSIQKWGINEKLTPVKGKVSHS